MTTDRYRGWMIAGLGLLASVLGGVLLGEQASAEMEPFYANVAARAPLDRDATGVEIVDGGGTSHWVETPDFGQAQSMQDGTTSRAR